MEMCAWMTGIVQNLLLKKCSHIAVLYGPPYFVTQTHMYTCPVCTVHGEERLQKKALPDFLSQCVLIILREWFNRDSILFPRTVFWLSCQR